MLTIRTATNEDIPQVKELWKRCFGDTDAYVDMFYKKYCTHEQVLIVEEEGDLNSMCSVLPTTLLLPDGTSCRTGYIYALATNPYIQGKGHARQLLAFADEHLQKLGMQCLTLVPASPSLHRYFENMGLVEGFATRKLERMSAELTDLSPLDGSCKLDPILPCEYNEIRERQLADTPHIVYNNTLIQFQQFACHLSAGDLYRVEIEGEVGCVSIEYVQRTRLLMKELLISPGRMEKAVQLISEQLPAVRYHVRTPASWEGMQGSYIQAFGMVKWYDREIEQQFRNLQRDGYLGLAFD